MAGLSSTGFTTKTIDEILSEIETDQRAKIAANLDQSPTSVVGQLNGIFAEREYQLWLVLRDLFNAFTPGGATGNALARLSLLTGTRRQKATRSTVTATVNLDNGVTLPQGSQASVSGDPTAVFETTEEVSNSSGSAANVSVDMQSVDTGPIRANAGTLTEIETPISGWNSITNAADATLGQNIESDADLRARREEELRIAGAANLQAIVADVLAVEGVSDVRGFENKDHVTSNGLPPKSFQIVVWDAVSQDAADNDLAQAIWDAHPVGIEAFGSTTGTATDDAGVSQSVDFDRAESRDIYIDVTVATDGDYPVDGDTQIKEALADFGKKNLFIGDDLIYSRLFSPVFSVSGVTDVTSLTVDFSASPAGTSNLTLGSKRIGLIDTSRINVTS